MWLILGYLMCFLWGVGMYRRLKQPRTGAAVLVFMQIAAEECLLLKEVADCALKAKYKVYSSEVLGKRRHQAGSKMGHCLFLDLYHRHF